MLFLDPLNLSFSRHSDASKAASMSAYMKNKFDFFAIFNPQRMIIFLI